MQDHEPSTLGNIWLGNVAGGELPRQPVRLRDLLSRDRDDVLMLRDPQGVRTRNFLLFTIALMASFALGWAGGLTWPELAGMIGLRPAAEQQTASSQPSDTRSAGKAEGARKTASHSDLQPAAPAFVGSIPKPSTPSPARLPAGLASQANTSLPSPAAAMRQPLAPAPETRPTTIPGWTVVDVRDGTAVLDGPDGIRMAARGDTIPGLGRVDSIVRWGSRWIVATANGLIATP
ncbi:hypothetical protein [Bradyrhizobium iriomotense]|uniref:Uncharacterized protein n=1 Tax=Bradyrhizobium iriomotense TaxID=441950 RepID=A0ABQ6B0L8_9BRAD|nr:hypothetical protein [Bradyrhizobium iriomotense]GLR86929.1 hypothetical protein GCM10007857_36400 [Bradyrhizobium iriomotense]